MEIGGRRVGLWLRHSSVVGRGCLGGDGATSGHQRRRVVTRVWVLRWGDVPF